jgi:hypothetical protein
VTLVTRVTNSCESQVLATPSIERARRRRSVFVMLKCTDITTNDKSSLHRVQWHALTVSLARFTTQAASGLSSMYHGIVALTHSTAFITQQQSGSVVALAGKGGTALAWHSFLLLAATAVAHPLTQTACQAALCSRWQCTHMSTACELKGKISGNSRSRKRNVSPSTRNESEKSGKSIQNQFGQ